MVRFTVDFSPERILEDHERRKERAIFDTSNQIIADSNFFCKEDTGTLKDSVLSNSRPEHGIIRWLTPYAAHTYNDPRVRYDKNPNASAKWFEVARDQRLNQWIDVFKRSYSF